MLKKLFMGAFVAKKLVLVALLANAFIFTAESAEAAPRVGNAAPTFSVVDTNGQNITLESLRGKTVVLEWTNYGCPFVRKHYDTGHMQSLQEKYASDNLVWIGVMSSAKGKEGFYDTDEAANAAAAAKKAHYTHLIRDAKGDLGKLYGATTTPHMFIIDKTGRLAYQGAIDDTPSADKATIKTAKNYVTAALAEVLSGGVVTEAETKPYGCSVKY